MARWIVTVETDCTDPNCVDEFHEWYNQVHLRDVLSIPEVTKTTRYENATPTDARSQDMAAYEVEADDIQEVLAEAGRRSEQWAAEGRISDLMEVTNTSIYRLIYGPVS